MVTSSKMKTSEKISLRFSFLAPIVTATPQQALEIAAARGVIVDSGIRLLNINYLPATT